MMLIKIAGDTVMDWIISDRQTKMVTGGVGNVYRGLAKYGIGSVITTLYNPLFPVDKMMKLSAGSVMDLGYQDVYIRDYDNNEFKRFRSGLRPRIFSVKDYAVVVAHRDSCIKDFISHYADIRDPDIKGQCKILRMSSTDDYEKIMFNVEHITAVVTSHDHVLWFPYNTKSPNKLDFERVRAIDDIGAGDTFNVGFLVHSYSQEIGSIAECIQAGISLAQEKVQGVGVFLE